MATDRNDVNTLYMSKYLNASILFWIKQLKDNNNNNKATYYIQLSYVLQKKKICWGAELE